MSLIKFFEEKKVDENIKECKGLVFRGYASTFSDYTTKRVERKEGIRLLKRKSCPGCPKCGFFFDDMLDMIAIEALIFPEKGIEDGKLYTLIVTNVEKDWESGMVDAWDYEIIEYNEK